MEIGQANVNEINGVNLDNYIPYQRNYDTVLYVHKQVLKEEQEEELRKVRKKKKGKEMNQANTNERNKNESVLEQTVRFAKQLAPIVIPPNEGSNAPVFYTVETCTKCKKRDKKRKEVRDDATYEKKKCKKIIETYRKERQQNRFHSTTESVTHTSESTLDDINNQSLNCTISEQSDKRVKYIKNEVNSKRRRNKDKFIISESFEAVATEYTDADDTKIKIQLMNNAEKNAFCDSIKSPVLNAVRECISEYSNIEVREEVRTVRKQVTNNADKLDMILDRLACIEKHLQKNHTKVSPSPRCVKTSTLELLGEDIDDEKSEEEFEVKRNKTRHEDNRVDTMGCGEVVNMRPSSSVGVKTERALRIPARYCWTDANKDSS